MELAVRLDRRLFEPVVCCLSTTGPLAARLQATGIGVHALGFRGFRSARFKIFHQRDGYVAVGERTVDAHPSRAPGNPARDAVLGVQIIGTFVGRAGGVPIVIASGRSLGLFKAGNPQAAVAAERIADRMTDLFIANSEAVRADTIAREHIRPSEIIVIRNGLDLARGNDAPDPELAASLDVGGRPTAIVVSNFIYYKGHEYLLRAWREVLVKFPTAVAMLAGDGVRRAELERMADDLQIRHGLRFLGVRHDVPALLALADLYVHPSLKEGYSNALLEAMAAGKAVVATAVGGNVEAVSEGVTGLLVPARDPPALEAAMTRLLADPAAARQMGDRASR